MRLDVPRGSLWEALDFIKYSFSNSGSVLDIGLKQGGLSMCELDYGLGMDCPVFGGKPRSTNCPCTEFEKCVAEYIIPLCFGCTRRRTCPLEFTSECDLFMRE